MTALYNEIEPYAAQWLRDLSDAGHIAKGNVDERSIKDLRPGDLAGYQQCHFFAGIGVWSYALRLAGVPDDFPVWTGSCPCQPFSSAGKGAGFADDRHLWPVWFPLIRECRPPVVFGEQVANGDGLKWFDLVSTDLENAGYTVAEADLCAAGIGAPHLRQRLYFVAYARGERCERLGLRLLERGPQQDRAETDGGSATGNVADAHGCSGRQRSEKRGGSDSGGNAEPRAGLGGCCGTRFVGDSNATRLQGQRRLDGIYGPQERSGSAGHSAASGFWADADWLPCLDGKWRAVEPGTFPLAHGVANRVGRLRAYGNAIVAPLAATFIRAALEAME